MKKYHLVVTGSDVVYGLLFDEDNNYVHNYREDSYVCDSDSVSLTLKARSDPSFWIIERNNMDNLKNKLCNELVEKRLVEEGDMIYHSYTNNRLSGRQYYQQDRIYDSENVAICQSANESFNPWYTQKESPTNIRIRKLTPNECWRLMGFDDESFAKAKQVNSDSQLYKQAGNSIVVNVLMAIFNELL